MGIDLLRPSQIGAPGSINIYANNGHICPSFAHFVLASTDRQHFFVKAIEHIAPVGSGGQPRQYALVARQCLRLDDGTVATDLTNFQGSHDEFNDIVQGGVICDGPSDGNVTSSVVGTGTGTTGLLVSFGSGNPNPDQTAQVGLYWRVLGTDSSTPWNAATSVANATHASLWQIIKAGPDLYAVCDAGVAGSIGDYRVSKCLPNTNPLLTVSWGNGVEVGQSNCIITGLAFIGDAPVAGKGDGLYYYNGQTRRYENIMPISYHALNFKCLEPVVGGVIGTTHDGGVFFCDGVSTQEISPKKLWPIINRDIGNSRVTWVAESGSLVAMGAETNYQTTQSGTVVVNTVTSAGAATAITTNLFDGNLNTGGDLDSLAATSFIDIWRDKPFEGVIVHITRKPNSTVAAVIGNVSYSSANDTFTADPVGFIDGTRLQGNATTATSGGSFSYVAFPPSASAGVIMGKSPNWGSLQQAVTFNYSSGTDVTTPMYGMRISMSGAALDSDVEIDEMEFIEFRPGMPNGGIYSASNNFTARDRAGVIQHVYILQRKGTNTFIPYDAYAVNNFGATWQAAWHSGRLGQSNGVQNLGQQLVLWGRFNITAISESPTRDPIRSRNPVLAQVDTTKPGPLWDLTPAGWEGKPGENTRLKTLEFVHIDTEFVQRADRAELFAQGDQKDIISLGVAEGGPCYFGGPDNKLNYGPFRHLRLWLGISDAGVSPQPPQYLEPVKIGYSLGVEPVGIDGDTATPEAT